MISATELFKYITQVLLVNLSVRGLFLFFSLKNHKVVLTIRKISVWDITFGWFWLDKLAPSLDAETINKSG